MGKAIQFRPQTGDWLFLIAVSPCFKSNYTRKFDSNCGFWELRIEAPTMEDANAIYEKCVMGGVRREDRIQMG